MPGERRRERKIVTAVFCDLVGFTARSETMDPEDVEAMLRPYHERVRSELERHGGTVEKFIGDAVMALFGAPTAHEDDPERAVRAAIAIRDFAREAGLELRVGITTGEALVSLDANPALGEGMASGDVVNTASRLQSAAPVNGILVDDTTHRSTRSAITYEKAEPVVAKGKAEPIEVWQATAARSRFGIDVTPHARTELVGRERELSILRDAFDRACRERVPQLATLVAVPGMGKSRLVYELQRIVEADPQLIAWRQGRCLAYGSGVAFWALGEVVKAEAGIVEQDTADVAAGKLHAAVVEVLGAANDAGWVEAQLGPLVGLESETGLGGDRRGQAFAAWRRYLEALAERRPLVIVFEDLHWADDGLLDFIDELMDWLTESPLLVVCSARPELLERRPGWGGGKMNATTIGLTPLSSDLTARLISQVLQRPLLPAEIQHALLERAEGNPLFAEQFAELYVERGSTSDLQLPETLQGILAARLDGLSREEKSLLQDASVVGKVFWARALGAGEGQAQLLHGLERKGFLIRQRRTSVEGEGEWSFAHMLLRDTAYGQIPRAERARKHRQAAEWIAGLGRPDDHAEMLAFHWSTALDLARAAGIDTTELERPAREALRAAGDRAFAVYAYPRAADYYGQALALWPAADSDRPELLYVKARALYIATDEGALAALEEARDALLSADDRDRAAEAESLMSRTWRELGDRDRSLAHMEAARKLVGDTASPAAARVLGVAARLLVLGGDAPDARQLAVTAYEMAKAFALPEVESYALTTVAMVKMNEGDPTAMTDAEAALAIAVAVGSPTASGTANNIAIIHWFNGDLRREGESYELAGRLAQQFGDMSGVRWAGNQTSGSQFMLGNWTASLRGHDVFIAECEGGSPHFLEAQARWMRSQIRLGRGDIAGAMSDIARGRELAEDAKEPQVWVHQLGSEVVLAESVGRHDEARALARQWLDSVRSIPDTEATVYLVHWLLRTRAGEELEAEISPIIDKSADGRWRQIALACLALDYARAADLWHETGGRTMEAAVRELAAEHLIAAGRQLDAEVQIERALEFYREVGADFCVDRLEALRDGPRAVGRAAGAMGS